MRARSLKPGFFKNEILGSADPLLSILFEGLWCMADREGRLEDRPLRVCAEVFPYRRNVTEKRCDTMLQWLHREGFIARYEVDGRRYIQILMFWKHQRPHQNESPSVIPALRSTSAQPGNTSEVHQGAPQRPTMVHLDSEKGNKRFALTPDSGLLTPYSLTPDSGLLTPDSGLAAPPSTDEHHADPELGSEFRNGHAPEKSPQKQNGARRNGNFERINDAVLRVISSDACKAHEVDAIARVAGVSATQVRESIRQLRDRGRLQ